MKNKIGVVTSTYPNYNADEAMAGISAAGFTYVELASAPAYFNHILPLPEEATDADVRDLLGKCEGYGLELYCIAGHTRLLTENGTANFLTVLDYADKAGVRFVTINTFITVFNEITWDIHGSAPFTSIEGMRDIVAPMYDQGYSALIEDLSQRGMLDKTLVCNLAEFGRTPKVNPAGGRDHWPQCWSIYFAGGGVQGGRAVGRSDEIGGYPAETDHRRMRPFVGDVPV